jgi:hypothetical protein
MSWDVDRFQMKTSPTLLRKQWSRPAREVCSRPPRSGDDERRDTIETGMTAVVATV